MAGGNRKEYKMYIKIAGEIDKSLPESARLSKAELRAIAREASAASVATSTSFRKGLQESKSVFDETKPMFDKFSNAAKKATKVTVAAVTAASVALGTFSVKTGMAYESQMSTVRALSQASDADMLQLDKTAQHLGATTVWTAKESGQAMEYMAMAGWNAKQMVDAVPATMDLASASGEDLAEVSDIVTDSMTAFNMKAKEASHFTDVLAAAATSSNTNVGKLGESFKYAAPLAGSLGYSIEDTSLALGLMANSGIKASQAGTSMRSWLTRMAKPTDESAAAMKKLGLSLKDSHGKMKPLRTVIKETRSAFSGLSKSQKAQYAAMLAGKTGMSGLLAVVQSADGDFSKLSDSIDNCNGAAKKMAETKLDNLEGDVTLFKSAMDGAGLEIYDEIKEPLRDVVQEGTKWVTNFAKEFKENFPTIKRYVSDAGEAIAQFATPLIQVGDWLVSHPDAIVGTITGIGTALITYKVASGVTNLATSLSSLSSSGLGVLGLTGAVGVVTGIAGAINEANRIAKDASLDEHFGNVALSMDDIKTVSKEIVGAKKLERVSELLSSMSKTKGFANELKEANSAIKKMHWKTSIGMEFSDSDKADYETNVKQYVDSAQKLIEQNGYEVNIATSLLFDDSPEKTQLLKNDNYFYKELDGEVSKLSDKINSKLQKGIKKGFSPDLQNEIDGLLNQMSEITNAFTKADTESSWKILETEWSGKALTADSFKNLKSEIQNNIKELEDGAKDARDTGITNAGRKKELGYIDQKEYEVEVKKYKDAYDKTTSEAKNRGIKFLLNSTLDTYGEDFLDGKLSDADKGAMGDMLSDIQKMKPDYTTSESITSIQTALSQNALTDFDNWLTKTFSKDETGLYGRADKEANTYVQDYFGKKEGAGTGKKNSQSKDTDFSLYPQFDLNKVSQSTNEVTSKIKGDFKTQLQEGVSADIPIKATGHLSQPIDFLYKDGGGTSQSKGKVKKHAKGGIFSSPHIGMIAEAGYSESIIPLDGSKNAYNLLGQTAQLMGVEPGLSALANQVIVLNSGTTGNPAVQEKQSTQQPVQINFAPVINMSGDADKKEIQNVLSDEYEKFKRFMKRYNKDGGRVEF